MTGTSSGSALSGLSRVPDAFLVDEVEHLRFERRIGFAVLDLEGKLDAFLRARLDSYQLIERLIYCRIKNRS